MGYFTFKAEHEAFREHLIRLELLPSNECDLRWRLLQLAFANTVRCMRSDKTSMKREGF